MNKSLNLFIFFILLTPVFIFSQTNSNSLEYEADIVIYGGTSSGVIAAVKAAKLGRSVLLVSPDIHLGGMSSNGLGFTDSGHKDLVGGLAREFYHRVYKYYQNNDVWNWVPKSQFKNKGQGTPAIDLQSETMWTFEPHVAEFIFDSWIKENNIKVLKDEWLDREKPIDKKENTIDGFYTLSGKHITGKVFIDASYEGDLMAESGVSFHVGREANSVYNEKYNGIQKGVYHHHHNFKHLKIDPFKVKGKPKSGILPKISTETIGKNGLGDQKVEAYCYRLCLTKVEGNKIPFFKPEGYDPMDYEILGRVYEKGWDETFHKFDAIPNGKTDVNNHGPFSFDNIGMNYDYPEASYKRRKEIMNEHKQYQQGLLYFVMTDPRVPEATRNEIKKWGYAKDEFIENNGFPNQIYVR